MKRKHPTHVTEALQVSRPRSDKTNKPFLCHLPQCPSGFKHKRDLLRHILAKHPETMNENCSNPEFLTLYFEQTGTNLNPRMPVTQETAYPPQDYANLMYVMEPAPKTLKIDFQDYSYETQKFEKRI